MEIGSLTERSADCSDNLNTDRGKKIQKLGNSVKINKTPIKYSNTFTRSPEKPPRGNNNHSNIHKHTKSINKATIDIKNSLSKAIDQAHKTLFYTVQNRNRSISPCLSSASSRYSTPSKKTANMSVMSSN